MLRTAVVIDEMGGERLAEHLPATTGDCPAVPRVAEVHGLYWDLAVDWGGCRRPRSPWVAGP